MPHKFAASRGWAVATVAVFALVFTATAGLTTTVIAPAAAQGNVCVAACKSSHNQCRIATKGSTSCDAQLQSCLQSCLKK
jgi:hypothetical protein